jgi:hypothetical protein
VLQNVHDGDEHRVQTEYEDLTGDVTMRPANIPDSDKAPPPHYPQNSLHEASKIDTASAKSPALEEGEVPTDSKSKRKLKKKKQLEDQDNQWLGDKVRRIATDYNSAH